MKDPTSPDSERPPRRRGLFDEPTECDCCGSSSEEIAIDDLTALCLGCQPCPWCGRMGTGCQDRYGDNGCDPVEYPDRPRRPFNDVMDDIAEAHRGAAPPVPHT